MLQQELPYSTLYPTTYSPRVFLTPSTCAPSQPFLYYPYPSPTTPTTPSQAPFPSYLVPQTPMAPPISQSPFSLSQPPFSQPMYPLQYAPKLDINAVAVIEGLLGKEQTLCLQVYLPPALPPLP